MSNLHKHSYPEILLTVVKNRLRFGAETEIREYNNNSSLDASLAGHDGRCEILEIVASTRCASYNKKNNVLQAGREILTHFVLSSSNRTQENNVVC